MASVSVEEVMAAVEKLRRDMQGEIATLKAALAAVKGARPAAAASAPVAAASAIEVSPEVVAILAASITAFLGKKVRIRSAKMLQTPYEIVNPWAQRGRVFIHASRNLPRRR
ncbi:MAG TPA: hypothetical protein HPQ04_09990 [Rhodospirillaceae bacterium]|nr:hypothetical protein [Rhodospirillaceae bacterium]